MKGVGCHALSRVNTHPLYFRMSVRWFQGVKQPRAAINSGGEQ